MSIEFNGEHRNANISIRSCSFCRRPGHNITRCNSQIINNFERLCVNYISLNRLTRPEGFVGFRNFLLGESIHNSNLVRAFSVRRCGSTTRSNIDDCIENIIHYFSSMFQNRRENYTEQSQQVEQTEQEDQISQLPIEPDEPETGSMIEGSNLRRLTNNNIQAFISANRDSNPETIFLGLMVLDMIMSIREPEEINIRRDRRFDIEIKILENEYNLHEKCECNICYDEREKNQFVKLNCGHEFCKDCIKKTLQNEIKQSVCCAFCRIEIKTFELRLEIIKDEFNQLIKIDNSLEEVN